MRPHVSGTERVGFSKARHLWESGSSITTVDFSFFRLLRKASAVDVHWTEHDSYLSFSQKSSSWHFLALAKLRSTARKWNHQRISKLVNWLIVACLWQLPRASLQDNSAGLPCYKCFAAGYSTYPCHIWHLSHVSWQFSLRYTPGQ